MAQFFLWIGLTLIVAFQVLLPPLNMGGAVVGFQLAGAIVMIVGCVLLLMGK